MRRRMRYGIKIKGTELMRDLPASRKVPIYQKRATAQFKARVDKAFWARYDSLKAQVKTLSSKVRQDPSSITPKDINNIYSLRLELDIFIAAASDFEVLNKGKHVNSAKNLRHLANDTYKQCINDFIGFSIISKSKTQVKPEHILKHLQTEPKLKRFETIRLTAKYKRPAHRTYDPHYSLFSIPAVLSSPVETVVTLHENHVLRYTYQPSLRRYRLMTWFAIDQIDTAIESTKDPVMLKGLTIIKSTLTDVCQGDKL